MVETIATQEHHLGGKIIFIHEDFANSKRINSLGMKLVLITTKPHNNLTSCVLEHHAECENFLEIKWGMVKTHVECDIWYY